MQKLSIKNHLQESRLFQSRCMALLVCLALIILIILGRLFYLQVFHHRFYSNLSHKNVIDIRPIAPKRGLIYDRHGTLIARNIPTFTLTVTPDQAEPISQTIKKLRRVMPISQDDINHFKSIRDQYHAFDPIPLKFKLSEQEVDSFYLNRYHLPGVNIQAGLMRDYPLGRVTSHIIGYVGRINPREAAQINTENYSATIMIGKTGIEKQFESELHGQTGNQTVETDASGRVIHPITASNALPGDDLYLTIDSDLQKTALSALGKQDGAIVAVEPSTGQILAMASAPTYDANDFVRGLSHQAYRQLANSKDHPLINRAIHGVFAAASTAKPFYALEGYNSGLLNPSDSLYDPGWFKIAGTHHIYHDWHAGGHGWVNARKAIAVSCDTFFYHLALKLGLHRLDTILLAFGFGNKTGIALPSESAGLVPTPDWKMASQGHPWYSGDTVVAGIGQGYVLVTPLQLAMATAALAEHGKRFKPQIILKSKSSNQANASYINDTPLPSVPIRANWMWNNVIAGMRDVITKPYGTGVHFGRDTHYTVAAKTGTAQVYGHTRDEYRVRTNLPKRLRNDSLFIAFAPLKNPKIALVVVVEHDANAPQIARKVLDHFFQSQHDKKKPV